LPVSLTQQLLLPLAQLLLLSLAQGFPMSLIRNIVRNFATRGPLLD
jgi:hypothetical protein